MALLRILLGILIAADLIDRSRHLEAHYSDSGILPRIALQLLPEPPYWSLHALSGSWQYQALLFVVGIVAAISVMLGIKTKFALLVSFILSVSLQSRNPLVLNGGDTFLKMLIFWSLFLPLDRHLTFTPSRATTLPASAPQLINSPASMAYMVQLMAVYLSTVAMRTTPEWWEANSAVHFAFNFDQLATNFARYLRQYPELTAWLTYLSIRLELWGPIALLCPWFWQKVRIGLILAFAVFHVAIAATLGLWLFSAICITAWIGLLPPRAFSFTALAPSSVPSLSLKAQPLHLFIAATLGLVLAGNILPALHARGLAPLPRWIFIPARIIGIDQKWTMFSPAPTRADGQIRITPANGGERSTPIFLAPSIWETKQEASKQLSIDYQWGANLRWRRALSRYIKDNARPLLPFLARFACQAHNRRKSSSEKVTAVRIEFELQYTFSPWRQRPDLHKNIDLGLYAC